jgi:hypothetical protein
LLTNTYWRTKPISYKTYWWTNVSAAINSEQHYYLKNAPTIESVQYTGPVS